MTDIVKQTVSHIKRMNFFQIRSIDENQLDFVSDRGAQLMTLVSCPTSLSNDACFMTSLRGSKLKPKRCGDIVTQQITTSAGLNRHIGRASILVRPVATRECHGAIETPPGPAFEECLKFIKFLCDFPGRQAILQKGH